MFPHAARDFIDGKVDALVHVIGLGRGIDDDMVGAKEDDFGFVPAVPLNIENGFGLNDARVVQVNSSDFFDGVLTEGISDVFVTHGHGDLWVYVSCLHNENLGKVPNPDS